MAKKKRRTRKRKIIPMLIDGSGVLYAGVKALEASGGMTDMEAAGKAFAGNLTAAYSGYNVIDGNWDLMALFAGYGPPMIRRLVSRAGFRINWPI